MRTFWEWIKGRSGIEYRESEGIGLALQTVDELNKRTFKIKGPGMKHSGIPAEEITRFLRDELPGYYNYYVSVKNYLDKKDVHQAEIEIMGVIGMRGKSSRYNPLDKKFIITTEN